VPATDMSPKVAIKVRGSDDLHNGKAVKICREVFTALADIEFLYVAGSVRLDENTDSCSQHEKRQKRLRCILAKTLNIVRDGSNLPLDPRTDPR
jgi:hypothetical protein